MSWAHYLFGADTICGIPPLPAYAFSKNLKIVKEACGHGSLATTSRYAHVNNESLHKEMANLNRRKAA